VRSVADFARGTLNLISQQGQGRMFKSPTPGELGRYVKKLARNRPRFRPGGSRSTLKMLLKTLAAIPLITIRNWKRRLRGEFPVTILFHHLVSDKPHRMGMSTEHFLKQVQFLRKHYQIVSLQQALEMLRANRVTRPTIVLTLDDGYAENFISLRAVVEETGIPLTLFISSTHVTRQAEFQHDIDYDCHGFLPLTWLQLRQLQASGFEIGSHTRTHFNCGSNDVARLQDEIAGSKIELENNLGRRIEFFAFPFGLPENISTEAAAIAMETYPYILSASGGDNWSPANGEIKHLKRWCYPPRFWELELQIQGVLEPERTPALPMESQKSVYAFDSLQDHDSA
jgi:peptidoglycan/xylan/chitin deacetylase (PgdA/CDA1 family)